MIDGRTAVYMIRGKFKENLTSVKVPLQNGRSFSAYLVKEGLHVDSLGGQSLLTWEVFEETVNFLITKGGQAKRGDSMQARLGGDGLPLDSIEGHLANVIYGRQKGDSVFRRISPIAAILVWARVCYSEPGVLILRSN
jgi:hypothetical protein